MTKQLEKNYYYIEATASICNTCHERVEAKIILENESVFILKNCLKDGLQKELLYHFQITCTQ